MTEPDCLGPCEPGSSVLLEAVVWHESSACGSQVIIETIIFVHFYSHLHIRSYMYTCVL